MQKITPFLWFDHQAEEAMQFYTSCFPGSKIEDIQRHPDGPLEGLMEGLGLEGKVLTGFFELAGVQFMALDGGSMFRLTPAISLFANCKTDAEVDALWAKLSEGGEVLMPLDTYPFSQKFGWVNDRYGLSWQINLGERAQAITPFLMFIGQHYGKAEEAINFYLTLFPNSRIDTLRRYEAGEDGAAGTVQHAIFRLNGQEFMASENNYAHAFTPTEAFSFYVECADQAEVDRLWSALSADPDAEQCGWLKDRYGVSWQIIPAVFLRLITDPDAAKVKRVMDAMLQMKKLDVAELERAYAG